jgi:hypothetical protein
MSSEPPDYLRLSCVWWTGDGTKPSELGATVSPSWLLMPKGRVVVAFLNITHIWPAYIRRTSTQSKQQQDQMWYQKKYSNCVRCIGTSLLEPALRLLASLAFEETARSELH